MAVAYTTLALTYEALDNERLAREAYEKAVSVAPKDFEVQNAYAVFLCQQQDFDGAQKYFAKAAEHPENDACENTLTNAGVCMMQKPNFEAAEEFFRAALDRKPALRRGTAAALPAQISAAGLPQCARFSAALHVSQCHNCRSLVSGIKNRGHARQ